jgi:hypothetical protein
VLLLACTTAAAEGAPTTPARLAAQQKLVRESLAALIAKEPKMMAVGTTVLPER